MQDRDGGITRALGVPLTRRVKESRVLLVGAGGIGCELLKNLVCCGFGTRSDRRPTQDGVEALTIEESRAAKKAEIVVIDLDTVDLSNLNRQFLFRKHHIKKPKAFVAKETASQFNPSVNIDAHHASIFDSQYDVDFFEGFDVVFNALDNLAARRHVNKMCLAANVPLIESGTTGFNGQVQVIKKGITECYDCTEKPLQKSFPICTIRSTPSQSIHCIVWAKSYLFPELFGATEQDSDEVAVTDSDNAEEVAKLKEEAEALKKIRKMMGQGEFAQKVFNKVFHDDIERLRSMADMWKSRKPPTSLKFETLVASEIGIKQGQALVLDDQKTWTLLENVSVFCHSLDVLSRRAQAGENAIEFDKDDKDTLDFVASTANLRSHVFGIPLHSEWEIKRMAANIIPAIATSNALTASLCVLEAFKVMRIQRTRANSFAKPTGNNHVSTNSHTMSDGKDDGILDGSKLVFLTSKNTDRLITTESLRPPRPDCPVCSPVYAKLILPEGKAVTLQDLVDLLTDRIGYEDFSIMADTSGVIYDPDLSDNLPKPLSELDIGSENRGFVTVMDDNERPKVDLVLTVKSQADPLDGASEDLQLLPENIELPLQPEKVQLNGETNGITDTSDQSLERSSFAGTKRKRELDEEEAGSMKKTKPGSSDVFVVEDEGAIVLDD